MRYDKILFDLDNTILDFNHAEKSAYQTASKKFELEFNDSYYQLYHEINDKLWKKLEKGGYERSSLIFDRWNEYFNALGVKGVNPLDFNKVYVENLGKGRKLMNNAYETLEGACRLGAKCYIVTNGLLAVQKNRLKDQPFMNYISGVCVSEAVGANKPDKAFFKGAEELFGVKFDDKTVVVGDSLSSDILGGINYGIHTIYVNVTKRPKNIDVTPTYEIDEIIKVLDVIK